MDRDVELIDIVILLGGTIIFLYYLFFVPPEVKIIEFPIYTKRLIYPAVIYVAPLVVTLWMFMLIATNCGEKRIRDLKLRKRFSIFVFKIRMKFSDGIQEYYSWREKNRKH